MITFHAKFSVYFDSSNDLKSFNQSLYRIKDTPLSVNLTESDFTSDEWITIIYLCDLTKKGSFFELDEPSQVNNLFSIIEKVKFRRQKAGFKKAEFPKCELLIWHELYELLPKE